jgi:HPt (histidine-containing phosphotransfer) domain-containing protein
MSEETLNLAVFAELQAATGPEFAVELANTFLDEAPGMIAELHDARAASDNERFQRAAHSLKSNANTFGAVALAAHARELEVRGLDDDPLRNDDALSQLETLLAEAAAALKALANV